MKFNIPSEYQAFDRLTICSNVLIGAGAIIKIGEVEPILIGKGLKFPAIWLKARANKNNWISVVERSVSLNPQIKITNEGDTSTTIIKIKSITILKAIQQNSGCYIDQIDLRPLGLNVFGTSEYLKVGQSEFKGNTFQGLGTFIGINE
ncbi:hypothetical protein [Labilibaculum euxinus]